MKQKLLFLTLFFIPYFLFAQKTFELKGKIVSQSSGLQDVNIYNKTRHLGTYSDEEGNFSIKVAVNDTLILSAIHLNTYNHIVVEGDKEKELLYIPMESNNKELDEVTLTKYKNITPEALGIIPYGIKVKTPAERRLAAANSGMLLTVINAINGKTKRLKLILENEGKTKLMEDIAFDFDQDYITGKFKIEEDYVDGFYYYLIEQSDFVTTFKSRNQLKTEFSMSEKAVEYLDLIQNQDRNEEKDEKE